MRLIYLFGLLILGFLQCLQSFHPTLQNPLNGYLPSCYNARNVTAAELSYCTFVNWGSGHLYSTSRGFSPYSPGTPLSTEKQDSLAELYSAYLLSTLLTPSSNCKAAASWFSCTTVFPYCPAQGNSFSSVSYLTTCRTHCIQLNHLCDIDFDCSSFKEKNCALYMPSSYVFLPPEKGPYEHLPLIYGIFAGVWLISLLAWLYICFTAVIQPNTALLKLITSVYFCRVGLCVTLCLFWIDCSTINYFCTSSSASNSVSVLRLLEAYQFFAFFLLSRGWMVTRASLSFTEWILIYSTTIVYLVCSFNYADIILTAPSKHWILFTSIIYLGLYMQIILCNFKELKQLQYQIRRLNIPGIMAEIYQSILLKYSMFQGLLVVFFILIGLELLCQILFISNISIQILDILFELISLVIMIFISYNFRPRDYSPFFFIIPVANRGNNPENPEQHSDLGNNNNENIFVNPRRRLPPLVVVSSDNSDEFDPRPQGEVELELAPLLSDPNDRGSSLIVVKKENGSVAIGIHTHDDTDASHHPYNDHREHFPRDPI